ncbi:MAG: pantoate--beta-alanine ligase [Thermomicrobiales bacterium]
MTVHVVRTPEELGDLGKGTSGLVPTMGALHAGHFTLIARAAAENDTAVVSIFVNPSQFGNANDLARYPRNLESDIATAAAAGAGIIYAPDAATVYPPGFSTWVEPGSLAEQWEGKSRPGHFRGVATVVSILLNSVLPHRSYFGEKDFQQLQVIRRMHRDLRLPGTIVASPTVRDMDGLALSSRNARLSSQGRVTARSIPMALAAIADASRRGVTAAADLESAGRRVLAQPGLELDYLAIVDAATLEQVEIASGPRRVLLAAVVDGVRLIDNIALPATNGEIAGHAAA